MTRRDEIFEVIKIYAKEHLGNSPSEGDLLLVLPTHGIHISKGTLQVHMLKLLADGRIYRKDGKLIIKGSEWIPPPED